MPPRKKLKVAATSSGGAALARSLVSEAPIAAALGVVPALQKDVCYCLEAIYNLRDGAHLEGDSKVAQTVDDRSSVASGDTKASTAPLVVDEMGLWPFPVSDGGTFIDVCQRAQANREWLIKESTHMVFQAGIIEHDDIVDFQEQFLTIRESRLKWVMTRSLLQSGLASRVWGHFSDVSLGVVLR